MSETNEFQVVADRGCFVCGSDNETGLKARLDVDAEAGSASCRIRLDDRFQGWQGVVHGGILSTLLDEVAIYACRSRGEQFVTAEINVRFRKPVAVGSHVELTGQIVESRRRIFSVKARLEVSGVLHAEADVRVMQLDQ